MMTGGTPMDWKPPNILQEFPKNLRDLHVAETMAAMIMVTVRSSANEKWSFEIATM